MATLAKLDPDRHAYISLPKDPKSMEMLKHKPKGSALMQRNKRMRNRRRFLTALGPDATQRVKDEEYKSNHSFRIASLHFHRSVLDLMDRKSDGRVIMPLDIPSSLAHTLSLEDCTFTNADKHEDGTYCPLPNYPPAKWQADVEDMERKAGTATTSPKKAQQPRGQVITTPAIKTRNSVSNPTALQHEQLKAKFDKQASEMKEMEARMKEVDKREKEVQKLKQELDKREAELIRKKKDMDEKPHILISGEEAYGLTRNNLSCKHWHKNNPKAANHFFGFKSWKETVYILNALYGVLPPTEYVLKKEPITKFEQYLMAYMQIHARLTVTMISFIFGRHKTHCGRLITTAAKIIGQAGKALSILEISPGYLELTCPQKYKDEGLEKCCAVPDGKDFMIHTTRSKTLFTRASYSDKVHHSAVRCISWSTPEGLSFEHTNLFLARVSEKRLVELWGPRLKKCPRGWFMLSDRGFFDTARYYPNMNHQKTPKFLSGRDQFTEGEVSADRQICKLRYSCEVAFSRVTKTKGLRDTISSDFFPLLDVMNDWGHATINLDRPLIK